jgi:hypothetical protein
MRMRLSGKAAASVAGLALGAAKWLATDHFHDLKRRLT